MNVVVMGMCCVSRNPSPIVRMISLLTSNRPGADARGVDTDDRSDLKPDLFTEMPATDCKKQAGKLRP
jgi:hypothetical protein